MVDRRRVSTFLSTRLFNPLVKVATNTGLAVPGIAILETTGRKSGRPRRTPVGRSLDGDTCWIVAEHGRNASYVRNIQALHTADSQIRRRGTRALRHASHAHAASRTWSWAVVGSGRAEDVDALVQAVGDARDT
jgi:deazaflavin-dependent oxidoreductase (nitroreductase family)